MTREELLTTNAEAGGMLAMIPSSVLLDAELPPSAKLLYGVITWRANRRGICWASNETLGADIGLSDKRVSPLVSLLEKRGHIEVKIEIDPKATGGRVRYISPVVKSGLGILKNEDTVSSEMSRPSPQKCEGGILKNEDIKYKKENIKGKPPVVPREVMAKIDEYCGDDAELKAALVGFVENRTVALKKPVKTEHNAGLIAKELDKLSGGERAVKIALLEKATMNNWQGLHALHADEMPKIERSPETREERDGGYWD